MLPAESLPVDGIRYEFAGVVEVCFQNNVFCLVKNIIGTAMAPHDIATRSAHTKT